MDKSTKTPHKKTQKKCLDKSTKTPHKKKQTTKKIEKSNKTPHKNIFLYKKTCIVWTSMSQ